MRFKIDTYNYDLPPELIRKEGIEPRDSARLFVYDTASDTVTFDVFRNLARYLPERALVVLNDTRVLPARLWLTKETGGKIEVFVLANQIEDSHRIPVLADRKTAVGQKLYFPNGAYFEVVGQEENIFFVKLVVESSLDCFITPQSRRLDSPSFLNNPSPLPAVLQRCRRGTQTRELPFWKRGAGEREEEVLNQLFILLEEFGETPLPHYLEGAEVSESVLRKRYQTVFAQNGASVAAPTAALHFTDEVFASLRERNIGTTMLTLDVGLGTFAPLTETNFTTGTLHSESVDISAVTARQINMAKDEGRTIVAIGTTVTRTLESCVEDHRLVPYAGSTDIFITPPYDFQMVDVFITNFHLPKTSLMLLVDAFLRHKHSRKNIVELYRIAIENHFAFYSFGDSMLIL